MKDSVTILGCRGSVPVSGQAYARYGGATSCVLVQLQGQSILLDAGTGMLRLTDVLGTQPRSIPLLLSHPHADHLLGLPMCPAALTPGWQFALWAENRGCRSPEDQLTALMSPPLWPIEPAGLPAEVTFHTISGRFFLGSVTVDCLEGQHPGGVTLFRLTCGNTSIVYIPDCTLTGTMGKQAEEFARDCTLLLCDGQYSPEEWVGCRDFGHSTWQMAAELGQRCRAGQTRILHHDPRHTDVILTTAETGLAQNFPRCTFAYEGERILL